MENAYEDWIDDVIEKFQIDVFAPKTAKTKQMPFDTNHSLTIFVADKSFGSDDVTAVALLKLLFDQTKVIRTSKKPSEREQQAAQTVWLNITRTQIPERGFFDGCENSETFNDEEFANEIGIGICGQIWKFFGPLILQKFGAQDEDKFVLNTIYREFLRPLDMMSKSPVTFPGSLIYALNLFNSIGEEDGDLFCEAVLCARSLVSRVIKSHVLRGNIYLKELAVMEAAFTDRRDEALLVLPIRCDSVHLFLKEYDPKQDVKFIIQPRNPEQETWQVWAVDYKRRRFHIDVPLSSHSEVCHLNLNIRSVHPGRYLAITCDRASAISLAKASLEAYQGNFLGRLKRWWWDE